MRHECRSAAASMLKDVKNDCEGRMPPVADEKRNVSVVIPAFNASEHLSLAIESVLNQTHKVDEIVVVDDGSTDNTRDLIASYQAKGVRYLWQKNQGSACARNAGIEATNGRYIAFLDADDFWLPNKIKLQLELFDKSSRLVLVSGDQIFWDVDRSFKKLRKFSRHRNMKSLRTRVVFENIVGNPSMIMIARSALENSGLFDPTLRFGDDWDMWIRLAVIGDIDFVPEPVSVYRWHKQSLSHRHRKECLASYRRICLRGIHRTIHPAARPLAYAKLMRHSQVLYNFRALKGQLASCVHRVLGRPRLHDRVAS